MCPQASINWSPQPAHRPPPVINAECTNAFTCKCTFHFDLWWALLLHAPHIILNASATQRFLQRHFHIAAKPQKKKVRLIADQEIGSLWYHQKKHEIQKKIILFVLKTNYSSPEIWSVIFVKSVTQANMRGGLQKNDNFYRFKLDLEKTLKLPDFGADNIKKIHKNPLRHTHTPTSEISVCCNHTIIKL